MTSTPGLALGIMTADCVPVLLCDDKAGVVGAAHAGWKGAVGGVLENTILAMEALGANREHICSAIGPCIWKESYEVGEDMRVQFPDGDDFFKPADRPNHWQFDLPGYVMNRLTQFGVSSMSPSPYDTYVHEDLFFSNRRRTHRNEPTFGCMLSAIALLPL